MIKIALCSRLKKRICTLSFATCKFLCTPSFETEQTLCRLIFDCLAKKARRFLKGYGDKVYKKVNNTVQ